MSAVTDLHAAVKHGDLESLRRLLEHNPDLANARSETDPRGAYALQARGGLGCEAPNKRFSNASLEDWQRCAELLQQR